MPYSFDDAQREGAEYADMVMDGIEDKFREWSNLGDEPFEKWEVRQIEAMRDHLRETFAGILFRTSRYMNKE